MSIINNRAIAVACLALALLSTSAAPAAAPAAGRDFALINNSDMNVLVRVTDLTGRPDDILGVAPFFSQVVRPGMQPSVPVDDGIQRIRITAYDISDGIAKPRRLAYAFFNTVDMRSSDIRLPAYVTIKKDGSIDFSPGYYQ